MEQNNIRDFNNQEYSVQEGAAIVEELDNRTKHNVSGYNSIAELGTKLKEFIEAIGDTTNLITRIEKEKIPIGSVVTSIQLTGNSFPKTVELFEEDSYLQEGDKYSYNPATGLITFLNGIQLTSGTNIYITKYY